ncbi:pyridine nucleotide-disulfide oxidoreductase [Pseudonocardia sulfidoxydans NBRC 16205]|uniref:Pyridine nucleotide-disulfide oxidoreductase n=1 Tax=Pseudonocardia sulfidoxydans NBRC 16205 TaxID=1223511 RepID=A0A511DKK0_9PSEU|nr:FAD/NAD(P)-binding oxidoreductase [Pseudonocardia sulfidoxydans]GEL24813.1 pyridine nucleotide-disulfide oxidoreductase [Pseudonocardia sulfidoxydans NBRC 16205]
MLPSTGAGVVVVGASVAGLHAAEALRDADYAGPVTVLDADQEPSCDRPPLSKQLLAGVWTREQTQLRDADALAGRGIDVRHGVRAVGLDIQSSTLDTSAGPLRYDGLVVATGATARDLPGAGTRPGLYTLRTQADCLALRRDLEDGAALVVVGAGFIGMEVAATARSLGAEVTVVDPLEAPMQGVLGRDAGRALQRLHAEHGVGFRLGRGVRVVHGASRVGAVELDDESVVRADAVLVGIGARPAAGWLAGAGLDVSAGLACDRYLAAAPHVVGAGDVVDWFNPRYGRRMRVEHWTNAAQQGAIAARNLLVARVDRNPADLVPYFWSDQYDVRIQFSGVAGSDVRVLPLGSATRPERRVVLSGQDGVLTSVLAVGVDQAFVRARRMLRRRTPMDEAEATVRTLLDGIEPRTAESTDPVPAHPSAPRRAGSSTGP